MNNDGLIIGTINIHTARPQSLKIEKSKIKTSYLLLQRHLSVCTSMDFISTLQSVTAPAVKKNSETGDLTVMLLANWKLYKHSINQGLLALDCKGEAVFQHC